jgi:ABC-2 type transport system permease protein
VNLHKTRLIANREYSAAVRSKSFLASLIVFPLLMSGAIIAQRVSQKIGDTNTYRVAVMNGSGDAGLNDVIRDAVDYHNRYGLTDSAGRQVRGRFVLESAAPANWGDKAALDEARLALSNRVRSGELLAFVEIGPAVMKAAGPDAGSGGGTIRYCSNRPTYEDFIALLRSALPTAIVHQRLANAGMQFSRLEPLLWWPPVVEAGLAEQKQGKITYQSGVAQAASLFVPLILVVLMFLVTLMGTSPMAANVIEEKQLRIAEVLLGSVTPMELMMGKLLGGVGVSLTLAAIFVGGAYYLAYSTGYSGFIAGSAIGWFFFFMIVGTLMYGSLFVASGAACGNIKEVQSFIMPVMLLIALPMFALGPILQNPSGSLATVLSFFPLSAPSIMVLRVTIPPGVAAWQPIVAAVLTLAATVGCVWVAARIFRVGILMQGKGASYGAVLRWIVRG